MLSKIRIFGNCLTLVGYFVLLYVNPIAGSSLKVLGVSLIVPFCIKWKLWDVVVLVAFFAALDISNIIRLII